MIKQLVSIFLLLQITAAQKLVSGPPLTSPWKTLNGQQPLVIARGGFSGLFPDSSDIAYTMAQNFMKKVALYCDLQLTKDNIGLCLTEIRLENTTNIPVVFPNGQKTYDVNGKKVTAWFSVDYATTDLVNVTLVQNILSRPDVYDGQSPIHLVEDVLAFRPETFWLNVQYDLFYTQHKLSASKYLATLDMTGIRYISSPEINFLKAMAPETAASKTKLILKFLEPDAIEPTTKQPYSAILKNIPAIKQFASGILVPKSYIWPIGKNRYLQPATTLVTDAHKAGLEVHAYSFANDFPASYNYSYDPTREYLQFIDNNQFSVDGVLTDFPPTAAQSVVCLAGNNKTNVATHSPGKVLIITRDGANGEYAACTDLAYEKAVDDGADIIDCPVQMSKDGVAFCSRSIDLSKSTNAATVMISQSTTIPELQQQPGIFSTELPWNQIKNLKPQLISPIPNGLPRNPAYKDKGKLMNLSDFLELAKTKKVPGLLINIEKAAYLASKKHIDVVAAVTKELSKAKLDKQSTQKVLIQSGDTSVLDKFKVFPNYRRVLTIDEEVTDITKKAAAAIKVHADAVDLKKNSIIPALAGYTYNATKIIEQMHAANISVHVSVLHNEFMTIPFDVYSDPLVYIATFAAQKVDGVVTDYPGTASAYTSNRCLDPKVPHEVKIEAVQPGSMLNMVPPGALPPIAPIAPLEAEDVVDPPLPSTSASASAPESPASDAASAPPNKQNSSGIQASSVSIVVYLMSALVLISLLSAGC